jgi:dTDP-4-dehydrorhamnose 3,5-epimerase
MSFIVEKTSLDVVIKIRPSIFEDHRGTYVETYNIQEFNRNGIEVEFVRDCISTSGRHVLRGLHYDDKTWKLIQCMRGRIYFVVVDMREESPQFLQWAAFTLTEHNREQILVPPQFANGHLVLSKQCIFHYKMSAYYDPDNEMVVKWDDPKVGIFWPVKQPILSQKDSRAAYLTKQNKGME